MKKYKNNFKTTILCSYLYRTSCNLFLQTAKSKIRFYNISSLYYKKIYKTFKIFCSVLYKFDSFKFNTIHIKTVLIHKQSKEYVVIREYLNMYNLGNLFYK